MSIDETVARLLAEEKAKLSARGSDAQMRALEEAERLADQYSHIKPPPHSVPVPPYVGALPSGRRSVA